MTLRLRHYLQSGLLHLLLLGLILSGAQCSHHVEAPGSIQGVLISSADLAPASKHALPPPPVPVPPADVDKEAEAKRQAVERQIEDDKIKAQTEAVEQQRQEEAKQQAEQKAEEKRQSEQKQQQLLAQQQAEREALQKTAEAEQKKRDEQKKAEDQKKADDAKKLAEAKKAADAAAEKKRVEDFQKSVQDEETKRLADIEKKKRDEAAKRAASDRMAQNDLKAQLGVEEKSRMQANWASQVAAAVQRRHNPPSTPTGCTKVRIVLSQSGEVQSATVARSTSNPQYDDSVVRAAYAASPLPLPADMSAFDPAINVNLPLELCPHP